MRSLFFFTIISNQITFYFFRTKSKTPLNAVITAESRPSFYIHALIILIEYGIIVNIQYII